MRGASGPLATTIFVVVSLAILLAGVIGVRAEIGAWWYTASVAVLLAVIVLVAVDLVRAVKGGTA